MTTARIPYPSHPYQSSASLAAMLIQNGLSGISQHDLAQKIDLVMNIRNSATALAFSKAGRELLYSFRP
ncbi:hypothetical protein DKK75_04715 [Bifidobacterium asteroides]|uniref:Uncharacterized protein n=1 Tax=Bifidobacterium asteroides TaxID=1684 RepID=A0A318M351_9BIFI|nr:hypothetical protein DKK75_04715 [Bifidobacterium asteroides]